MYETIQKQLIPPPKPEVHFTVTPNAGAFSVGSAAWEHWTGVYNYSKGTVLTFTPTIVLPTGSTVVETYWRFGDGVETYGSTVTHTYTIARPVIAHFRIKTNKGVLGFASKVLYLI